jgi:hypothetical protein
MSENIGEKVDHVLKARKTREHACHWPGCDRQCKPAMWGCRAHWFKLPKSLRDRIWLAYAIGQEDRMDPSAEYVAVAREAQDWIREHFPETAGR